MPTSTFNFPIMLTHLPAFLEVSPRLWTAGQPAPAAWDDVAQAGVEVVINLAPPGSHNYDYHEAQRVLEREMIYAHLPIIFSRPLLADYASFAALMQAHRDKFILVHCAANVRVSALVYLYRTLVEGEDESVARARMLQIREPDPIWSGFIEEVWTTYSRD